MLIALLTWQELTLDDFSFPFRFEKTQSLPKRHQGIKIPHLFNMPRQQNSVYAYTKLIDRNFDNCKTFVGKTDDELVKAHT